VIYNKAKAVLAQRKEGNNYGGLFSSMGICHKRLQQWSKAIACYKEAVEHRRNMLGNYHPQYVTTLYILADLFANLKHYEEAIARLEEALAIEQGVFSNHMNALLRPSRSSPRSASAVRSRCDLCSESLFTRRWRHTLLLARAPMGRLASCIAVVGLLAARAVQHFGQHCAALKADTAMWLVRWPVLQLAVGVAVPRTSAGTGVDGL
jgi:tetratricopeptide (TPR) repeat protein